MENTTSSDLSGRTSRISSITKNIWIYGAAFIIVFGTIGNGLSATVMTRKRLRRHRTSIYLVVLAIVDTAVLYTGLLRHWIREVIDVDVRNISAPGCKIHIFLVYFLVHFEAWILVWISAERLVAVCLPHRAKVIFTVRFVWLQITGTGFVTFIINLHIFWTVSLKANICVPYNRKYEVFWEEIWSKVDLVISSFVPFVVMFLMNLAIVTRLLHLRSTRKRTTSHVTAAPANAMSTMLITVNFAFLITTSPVAIYLTNLRAWQHSARTERDRAVLDLVWACVNMAAYTNNAINFLLYCLSGPTFKKELVRLVCLGKCAYKVHPQQASFSLTTATVPSNTRDEMNL
ncbi:hypothetical protein LSH36_45g07020 [Paralvinella palmiformis]|uniref:G-protein coupled receptors family 1 profile domain-containing protein n=1 Tax=Paralvinella palmiformis TaxID=53620 RepID=A0AAD9K6I3_9ANNE|nr:hypothetical protein LSH36_45g07020 [Paralvinella palmiformis]